MVEDQTPKPRRIWRIVLVISLALNLAVVGTVVGFGLRDKGGGPGPRGFDVALGPLGRALDREDRRAIADVLRSDPNLRPLGRTEIRDRIDVVVSLLQADTFDETAMADVLGEVSDRMSLNQAAAQTALIAHIAQMSDADRLAFAARIVERRAGRDPR